GISRRAPGFADALDLLLDGGRREAVDPQSIARLVEAVASSLHDVYAVTGVLAGITFGIPAAAGPLRPRTSRRGGVGRMLMNAQIGDPLSGVKRPHVDISPYLRS